MRVATAFTGRALPAGVAVVPSPPPYDAFDLGDHVGDDPGLVAAHRAALPGVVGAADAVFLEQVHGRAVLRVDGPVPGPLAGTDGVVTTAPGLALAVLVADCVPLLLADERAGVVAAVHAGRRGVVADIAGAALEVMAAAGARDVRAVLGPHIGPCCYEVGAAVRDEVEAAVPGTAATTTWGTPSVDLAAGLARQLAAAGVARVARVGGCTAEDPGSYSFRRDGVTGRMAGVVALLP